MAHDPPMAALFEQWLAAIHERFPHIRRIIGVIVIVKLLWNGVGNMIDAYDHARFLATHHQQAVALTETIFRAFSSWAGTIVTIVLGGVFLYFDSRYYRPALPSPDASPQSKSEPEEPWPIGLTSLDFRTVGQRAPGLTMAPTKPTGQSDCMAYVAVFTNQSSRECNVSPRLYYLLGKSKHSRVPIMRPTWLAAENSEITIAAGETRFLILALAWIAKPTTWHVAEDHRGTVHSALGVEIRELPTNVTGISIELHLSGEKPRTLHYSVGVNLGKLSAIR